MSQAFSFNFEGDDIELSTNEPDVVGAVGLGGGSKEHEIPQMVKPRCHTIEDLLSALPSNISYNTISIRGNDANTLRLPRRELFDIRAQLMAEDQSFVPQTETQFSVVGLSTEDITPTVYEGGFKTWECSVDLANYVLSELKSDEDSRMPSRPYWHIIELGAGTALPTLVCLYYFLTQTSTVQPAIHLTLADYNINVLESATIPNLLLTWYFAQSPVPLESKGDLEVTSELRSRFLENLVAKNIYVSGVSGSWGQDFSKLTQRFEATEDRQDIRTLILASETIYSPSSIRAFTEVLMESLMEPENAGAMALVAAKRIYFGVGGGVDEFMQVLKEMGGKGSLIRETEGAGVGRVILKVVL